MTAVRLPAAAEDLVATAQTLWPAPATAALVRGPHRDPGTRVVREFAFLPNAEHPRLIVPVGVPAAAAAAMRRYSQALSRTERYGRAGLALVLRTGVGERLLPDRVRISVPTGSPGSGDDRAAGLAGGARSVEDVLAEVLGEPVVVSLGLGNRRANQKPILHVLTPAGRTRAFVKVGDTAMARTLVRGEAEALRRVGDAAAQPGDRAGADRPGQLERAGAADPLAAAHVREARQGRGAVRGDRRAGRLDRRADGRADRERVLATDPQGGGRGQRRRHPRPAQVGGGRGGAPARRHRVPVRLLAR